MYSETMKFIKLYLVTCKLRIVFT